MAPIAAHRPRSGRPGPWVGSEPVEVGRPGNTKQNDGAKATRAASRPPPRLRRVADDRDGLDHRAGVIWPRATALRNWALVIQW